MSTLSPDIQQQTWSEHTAAGTQPACKIQLFLAGWLAGWLYILSDSGLISLSIYLRLLLYEKEHQAARLSSGGDLAS